METNDNTGAGMQPVESGNGKRYGWYALIAILLIIGGIVGFHYWQYASTHESTDDAQVTSDVVQISPQINGTIAHVLVRDNQHVNAGDTLVQFDDSPFRTAVAEAEANLDVATRAAEGAGVNIDLVRATTSAQAVQAQGGIGQAESGIKTAVSDVARAKAAVTGAQASAQGARASEESTEAMAQSARDSVNTASAACDAAIANESRSEDAVKTSATQVDAAKATLSASRSVVKSAQAMATKADSDAVRYANLFQSGAVSAQAVDNANAARDSADAQVESAQEQVKAAQAALDARTTDVDAAKDQVLAAKAAVAQANAVKTQAQSAVAQAEAQIKAMQQQVQVADAGVRQSQMSLQEIEQGVNTAQAKRTQSRGQLEQAQTAPTQVKASTSIQEQALAKVKQAKAALDAAQIQLGYTRIVAPVAGRISAKSAEEGALVVMGTPLMSIIPDQNLWVTANFKETQLTYMKTGQLVEITADAFPAIHFHAKVDSISAGSGATFALLPPDNATGNFTKVVQRIPVKLVMDPGQQGLDGLRAGMSVEAVVAVK